MATFKFGRTVNIHWYGNEIVGPADTVFSIPDQLYNEFESEFRPIEPSLTWINTNEGQASTIIGTSPVSVLTAGTTSTISFSSSTNPNGYLLAADGSGGLIYVPASTSGLTSVVGVSPISSSISGGIASVSLNASYQTAGTYVTGVVGTSPISATGTTSITVSLDQSLVSAVSATNSEVLRTYVKNSSGSTISKGQVVYVTGSDGTNALIGLATASTEAGSSKVLGIAASTMTNNAFGYIIENGQLSNIDTSAATAGSSVWLGNTLGSYVFDSPPAEPSNSVYLGVVTKANVSTGEVLVKVQNGYELDELHDVYVGGVSTALPLVYSSTSSGWVAQALTSVGVANDAIVTTKILDGAVTSAKIASGSINSTHIAANAVVSGDIAAGVVGSSELADNAVVAAKIAAGAVNTAKIDSTGGSNGWVLTANGSGGATFAASSAPSSLISFNTYTAAATLALTDQDKIVQANSTAAFTITVPPNSSVAFSTGSQVNLLQIGTGQLTIAGGTGVTVNSTLGLKLRAQWSSGTLIKRDTNTWVLVGDCEA